MGRVSRHRLLLLSTALVAAVTTACGGSGSGGTAADTKPAASTLPTGSAASGPSSSPRAGAPSASASSTASAINNAGGTGAAPAASAKAQPATRAAAPAVPLPPPGQYKYHATGSSSSFFGNQKIDDTATLTVDKPNGNREHTRQADSNGSTEQVLVSEADGLYLAEVHLSQTGFDEDFKPSGKALLFPGKPKQGQRWQWTMTSTDGKYTLQGHLTLADLHSSATTGDGKRVATVAVTSVLHITGNNFDITVHQRDESGHDALIVREHAVTNGTAYGTKVQSDVTSVLATSPS
jgi:hypothetical protein